MQAFNLTKMTAITTLVTLKISTNIGRCASTAMDNLQNQRLIEENGGHRHNGLGSSPLRCHQVKYLPLP